MFQVHLAPQRRPHRHASIKDVANIRHQLQGSIEDCTSESAHRLRKKIGAQWIQTRKGQGYVFGEPAP